MPSEVRILLSPRFFEFIDIGDFGIERFGDINQSINQLRNKIAGVAQLAEHNPSKVRAAGSSPVSRSNAEADVAQW
jgi:hypothetical protein